MNQNIIDKKLKSNISTLKEWAVKYPIPNLEYLQNKVYKNYNGYIGLPSDEDKYLHIEKLMLPLGDKYKGVLPKEIGLLKNLKELIIIARNMKNIPNEIFNLPYLKYLSVVCSSEYKISNENIKVLISNGCEYIRFNIFEMNKNNTNSIRDKKVIDYLNENELYITNMEFGIPKHKLYSIAKDITKDNPSFGKYIIGLFTDEKYIQGYNAYLYAVNNDEQKVKKLISHIQMEYEVYRNAEEYSYCLIEVGLSIVKVYPDIALEIYHEIDKLHDILESLPIELLDLSEEIVISFSYFDISKALEVCNEIIFIDEVKLEVLEKISFMSHLQIQIM